MIEDLETAIYNALFVQKRQVPDSFLSEVDDALGEIIVLRYAAGGVQYWRVEPNTDLSHMLAYTTLPAGDDGSLRLTWLSLRRVQIWRRSTLYVGVPGTGIWSLRPPILMLSGTVSYHSRISWSRLAKSSRFKSRMRTESK